MRVNKLSNLNMSLVRTGIKTRLHLQNLLFAHYAKEPEPGMKHGEIRIKFDFCGEITICMVKFRLEVHLAVLYTVNIYR